MELTTLEAIVSLKESSQVEYKIMKKPNDKRFGPSTR